MVIDGELDIDGIVEFVEQYEQIGSEKPRVEWLSLRWCEW